MRPDTRSFSFTWLKGQQNSSNDVNQGSRPTSLSSSSLANGETGVKESLKSNKETKLKRIGSSFLKGLESNYSAMENDIPEEENLENIDCEEKNLSSSSSTRSKSNTMSIGKRLNKTVQDVKTSLGNLSQRLRRSTRRRYRMGPISPGSEISPTRRILGRTPTKLYSPFGFDSPLGKPSKRLDRMTTPRVERKSQRAAGFISPSNRFNQDLKDAKKGLEDFQILSRDITRKSVRF